MKILVTGAAGFIGSNFCEYLLEKKTEVVAIDNFNDFYNPKIKEYNIKDFKGHENFKLYRTDILNLAELEKIFKKEKPDVIVHLAAWAGVTDSMENPIPYFRNNEEGTLNLIQLAIKHKIKNFIFASTSSVYGDNETPFIENMSTDHPLAPYPATKKASEVMLSTFNRNADLNVTIFRIFNPIGLRLRPDLLLPKLIRACLYDYECPIYWTEKELRKTARDYAYLPHMFDAICESIKKPLGYEIFNLGNSSPVYLGDVFKVVEKVVGVAPKTKEMPSRKGEMVVTYANIDKAKEILGYNPTTQLEEMVKIYYNWFKEQEDWYQKGDF